MQIIEHRKINLQTLNQCVAKPQLYEKGTARFWDDTYISLQMLKLHLNPEVESASRTKATIEAEAAFIIQKTGLNEAKAMLDLGCGPGLYVQEFAKTGARVTGVDLSEHSISYAHENIKPKYANVVFAQMNYLDLAFKGLFDVVTLIFYDFCVLSPNEQENLLLKINAALKVGGVLVFDVISENYRAEESTKVNISEGSGFWSPDPYIEIANTYLYENPKTLSQQYTIIAEDGTTKVTRLYTRMFSITDLTALLNACGFTVESVYKNLKGDPLSEKTDTYGVFARKAYSSAFRADSLG
jgi:2-polyprenyl-3-methyl-5-hydroxy-6-metoxy-1,4-benzoquinol methylase